jgi:hypothetical protein
MSSQQSRTQQTPKNGNRLNTVPSTVNNATSTIITPRNNVSTTSSTKSSSKSSKDASGGMSKEDADIRRKDKVPEWQMNINSFFCEKNKRKRCDSDDDTIEIVENESNHSPYSSDHLSPTNGLGDTIKNIMMGEEEPEVKFWDPRGFRSSKMLMPSTYCPSCRCPEIHCHNKVFGPYCELHIVHEVYHADYPLTPSTMESLYRDRYNDALQFKIYEKTTMLDVTPNGYPLPQCIRENSLTDCVDYINFRKYHFRMNRKIMMGRDTPFEGASIDE